MKDVKSSNEVKVDSIPQMIANISFVLAMLSFFVLFIKGPEAARAAVETVVPSEQKPSMSLHEWAALEYAQTCMKSIRVAEHCIEYTAPFTAEQLVMDLTQVEIR